MSKFSRVILLPAALAILAGCAKRPDAIAPASFPMEAYAGLSCPQLAQAHANEKARLAGLSAAQDSAATGDAVGVFLIGVPTASAFGGDKEGEVAVSKGKVQAMEAAALRKSCPLSAL